MTSGFGHRCGRVMAVAAFAALMGASAATPAAASGSESSTPAVTARDTDYADAVKAVKAKDFAGALKLLDRVVVKDPQNADAWNYIGFSDRMLGKFPDSLTAYEKALALKPDHIGANEYLGELYVQTGETEKARRQLARLEELCGENCDEYKELKAAISSGKAASLDAPGSGKGW